MLLEIAAALSITAVAPDPYRCTSQEWDTKPAECLVRCGMEERWTYFRRQIDTFTHQLNLGDAVIFLESHLASGDYPAVRDLAYLASYFDSRQTPAFGIEPRYLGSASYRELGHVAAHEVCHAFLHRRTSGWLWNGREDNSFFSSRHRVVAGCTIDIAGAEPVDEFLRLRFRLSKDKRKVFIRTAQKAYRDFLAIQPPLAAAAP